MNKKSQKIGEDKFFKRKFVINDFLLVVNTELELLKNMPLLEIQKPYRKMR
jgi:hypothetical protein